MGNALKCCEAAVFSLSSSGGEGRGEEAVFSHTIAVVLYFSDTLSESLKPKSQIS